MKKQFLVLGALLVVGLTVFLLALWQRWLIVPPIENYDVEQDEARRSLALSLATVLEDYQQEFSTHYPWNNYSLHDETLPRQPGARYISEPSNLGWLGELVTAEYLSAERAQMIQAAGDFLVVKDLGSETRAYVCFPPVSYTLRQEAAALCQEGKVPRIPAAPICATTDGSLTEVGQGNLLCLPQ